MLGAVVELHFEGLDFLCALEDTPTSGSFGLQIIVTDEIFVFFFSVEYALMVFRLEF